MTDSEEYPTVNAGVIVTISVAAEHDNNLGSHQHRRLRKNASSDVQHRRSNQNGIEVLEEERTSIEMGRVVGGGGGGGSSSVSSSDEDQKKRNKKKRRKQRGKMFDEEVDRYDTYEEYLDSLVSEEDHLYLEDEEMARIIAELGYRSSGDTLSRENFYKLKSRLAEKRQLTRSTNNDADTLEDAGSLQNRDKGYSESHSRSGCSLLHEIRRRAKDLNEGTLWTVVYLRTKVPRKNNAESFIEVSSHIDLANRLQKENFFPYVNGSKALVPLPSDLTYYNWAAGEAKYTATPYFEVVVKMPKLYLRHKPSGFLLDVSTTSLKSNTSPVGGDARSGYTCQGWTEVKNAELSSAEDKDDDRDDGSKACFNEEASIFIYDIRKSM